jgi:16S rRNA (guanine527-N7)-methyltransferase
VTDVHVSRETVLAPAPPAAAVEFFGAGVDRMAAYAGLLAGAGVERGLIGPREVPRLWERHLLNCAVIAELIPVGSAVEDVGSGAGLPGIVLALCRPDLRITLVEPLLRRSVFLDEACAELGLPNVTVVRQRAEDRKGAGADVVTARAVAPMDRLAGWCLPLLRPGGVLLALKGASATDELVQHADAIRRVGGRDCEVVIVGTGVVDPPTTVVQVVRNPAAQDRPVRKRKKGGRP